MSILKILGLLDTDQMSIDELDVFKSRREAFKKMGNFSKKLSMAAIPAGVLAALPKVALAQESPSVVDVLNYALTLEHLEYNFYQMGVDSGVVAAGDMAVIEQIRKHEEAHVAFLQEVITNVLMGTPVEAPTFDFTAGGTFADVFSNPATFMALAQAFEDTGVRAYKGQAGNLMAAASSPTMNTVLTAALSIHGVEARHASQIRRMRMLKGWITQAQAIEGVPATQPIYAGEDNVVQGGVDVTTLTDVGPDAVTEAYDEPLTMEDVLGVASLFIVSE